MKWLICFIALWFSFTTQAVEPVGGKAYDIASNVSRASDLQCAGTRSVDANGKNHIEVTDCVLRFAIMEGSTVMNFCYRFSSYDLMNAALGMAVSLYDLANNTPSMKWYWFPLFQQPPPDIDPRCAQ